MGFLSGSITCERFQVHGSQPRQFDAEHIEILQQFAAGPLQSHALDHVQLGFLGGAHLFDQTFDFEKNVFDGALHFAIRTDSNQIPSAIRKAWLQLELAVLTHDNAGSRLTKAQRKAAKEAVEQRCEEEAKSGKYHRMSQFPVLWEARQNVVYCGGSGASAGATCASLLGKAFDVELDRMTAGALAMQWATRSERLAEFEEAVPASFLGQRTEPDVAWLKDAGTMDFLGNEFLLWLWWFLDTQSDTLVLPDESEVTAMFARTLTLECPAAYSGKETVSSESPVHLPETWQAIRSGKLPRKAGLILVRQGQQFDLTLQAETFAVSGAKVPADDEADERGRLEARIDALRNMMETVDQMYFAFCERRLSKNWSSELNEMTRWLQTDKVRAHKPAA